MEASSNGTAPATTTTTTTRLRRLRRRKAKLTLSGHDRKIANERERKRVNTLNVAIGELKKRIPDLFVPTSKTKSTFGKLEVIKLATEYIDLLENTITAHGFNLETIQTGKTEDNEEGTSNKNYDILKNIYVSIFNSDEN